MECTQYLNNKGIYTHVDPKEMSEFSLYVTILPADARTTPGPQNEHFGKIDIILSLLVRPRGQKGHHESHKNQNEIV